MRATSRHGVTCDNHCALSLKGHSILTEVEYDVVITVIRCETSGEIMSARLEMVIIARTVPGRWSRYMCRFCL